MSATLNYQNLYEIDINPGGIANYVRVADGITSVTPANNENEDVKGYLDDDGGQSSEVTSYRFKLSFAGDRIFGDAAQDYIFGKLFKLGSDRHANVRQTDANGNVILGDATLSNLNPGGGDAGATAAIGFDIGYNGEPSYTEGSSADELTATIAAGTTSGTTTFTATPAEGNHLAYILGSTALTPNGRSYEGGATSYTSGDEIAAEVGQVLNMYELDAYYHVVKFKSATLASGDIG